MFANSSIVLDPGDPFDLVEVEDSSYESTDTNFDNVSSIVQIKVGESKNEWIENMPACYKFDILPVNTKCYYYSVFDTYSKFIDTNSSLKNVPKKN